MSSDDSNNKGPDDSSGCKSPSVYVTGNTSVSDATSGVCRVVLSNEKLEDISLEDLCAQWRLQDNYINKLETLNNTHEGECVALRENEEKLKQQLAELTLRERVLVRRLAAKEQDMQEYVNQLSEMKGGQASGIITLRSTLLDPAVNILIQKLRHELAATRTRLDDTQNELAAWKFTPDSNTGKRLMAKCRMLYQENEELGRMISSGRFAKLEGDLALQKSFSEEVKKSQSELDELLQDLDEDVEGMQSTIYYLQQELRKAKEAIIGLEQENNCFRNKENPSKSPSSATTLNGIASHHNGKWCKSSNELCDLDNGDLKTSLQVNEDRTKDLDKDSVVNNNVDNQHKRTASENSEDCPVVKKQRLESHKHYDDEVITNGDVLGQ